MNAEQRYESIEVEAKRKRLRKGTHSCWECKRRKVRCTFASPADSTCITCQRRGTRCVGQDVPEEECPVEDGATGSMERVEALLNKLVKTIDHTTTTENRPRRQPVEAQASRSDNDPRSSASRQPQPAAPPTVATRDSSSVRTENSHCLSIIHFIDSHAGSVTSSNYEKYQCSSPTSIISHTRFATISNIPNVSIQNK